VNNVRPNETGDVLLSSCTRSLQLDKGILLVLEKRLQRPRFPLPQEESLSQGEWRADAGSNCL
jgi:hypothetical protein